MDSQPSSSVKAANNDSRNLWYAARARPYLPAKERRLVARGVDSWKEDPKIWGPTVYHVDFTKQEVDITVRELNATKFKPRIESIESLIALRPKDLDSIPLQSLTEALSGRTSRDIKCFFYDLISKHTALQTQPQVLSLMNSEDSGGNTAASTRGSRSSQISQTLLARELVGHAGFGKTRGHVNFKADFQNLIEDDLRVVSEYTNCAGDVITASWIGNDKLICGTTAHSDTHNQQYNKMGNLLVCSLKESKLKAFPGHRIPRPRVEKGENSTEAMRQSQDPWLYSSVVSSDYNAQQGLAYTSSFDHTVKVWKVPEDEKGETSMQCVGTWKHEGNVNFVVAAKDESNRVATAADVPERAVRIYTLQSSAIGESPYQEFSCTRSDANLEKWAYFPATMQWGIAPGTQHLLAVGYSPRSLTGDDHDIPEDKVNSGEILLIDAMNGTKLHVMNATTTNVFEVAWHPSLHCFIAGTAPCGLDVRRGTRTQIHVFHFDVITGAFAGKQSLDCPASDINELTIMPNSRAHSYISAACTDGKVYVWDTAHPEFPIKLVHGKCIDELMDYDREKEDTGVKFTAWGATPDRFYTGGSDGVVRVWNIRNKTKPFLRTLLKAPGPIACGVFTNSHERLAIGDATGRLWVISIHDEDEPEDSYITLPNGNLKRRPRDFIPHAEPPPPVPPVSVEGDNVAAIVDEDNMTNAEYARYRFLDTQQVRLHPSRTVGAVKGPSYASTGLFLDIAHLDMDPSKTLVTEFEEKQQENRSLRRRSLRRLKYGSLEHEFANTLHLTNEAKEWDIKLLETDSRQALQAERAELELDWELDLDEDLPDDDEITPIEQDKGGSAMDTS